METTHFDTIIIGAGISGICAAHYMQADCPGKTYAVLEARKNIGGTWDLFRYPGIRSDSDMYTFGFAFKPWTNPKAIAPREDIIAYLEEAVREEGIDKHILFEHKLLSASWSSVTATWTLTVMTPDAVDPIIYTCSFLSLCMGYYSYENGYTPVFAGYNDFKGPIIHPQKWDQALDYADKKIVVIGSGATAMTMIPVMAQKAEHVTMLQRSPTYVVALPAIDKKAVWLNNKLPKKTAYKINRLRMILFQRFSYAFSRKFPAAMKKMIRKNMVGRMGEGFDIDKHFTPAYNPWDQRLCVVPNGDLFKAIKNKKAGVVTDHIEKFVENGIQLVSGDVIEADMIITATGLNVQFFDNVTLRVDGEVVDFSKKIAYKGVMFDGIPNLTYATGYTNASWTLKCEMTSRFTCRIINYMTRKSFKQCMPVQNDPKLELAPLLDFRPGYVMRVIDQLPKMGSKKPWMIKQNYFYDKRMFEKSRLDDGVLTFK